MHKENYANIGLANRMVGEMEHETVQEILSQYAIPFKNLTLIAHDSSKVFKVESSSYKSYALKIYADSSSTFNDNLIEAFFLNNIRDFPNLWVPQVVANKKGDLITTLLVRDKNIRAILMDWIDGEPVDTCGAIDTFRTLGETIAHLHKATCKLTIPPTYCPRKWDRVFYYKDEVPIYQLPKYRNILSSNVVELINDLIPKVNQKLLSFYSMEKPQLIHSDLNPWNVRIQNERLSVLDFEDAIFGLPIHDIANILFYYKNDNTHSEGEILQYLLEGYGVVGQPPQIKMEDIALLNIARSINFVNHALSLNKGHLDFIKKSILEIENFAENLDGLR